MPDFPGSAGGRYDYATGEHYTGVAWIDGLPIYRRVISITGGNASSVSAAVSELEGLNRVTIVRVDVALSRSADTSLFLFEQVSVNQVTGVITVDHTGVDFTGSTLHAIVEYTRTQ